MGCLQTVVSRNTDPVLPGVVTVGSFHAGEASNVIPSIAELRGTIRTVTPEQRTFAHERVKAISEGIAAAMGAEIEANILFGVPATVNTPAMAAIVREVASEIVGPERVVEGDLKAASEDMSEFLNRVPGCYYFVGSRNEEKGFTWGHHHARFDIDEEAMAVGISTLAGSALRFLEQNA